jgi:hypothetical protein
VIMVQRLMADEELTPLSEADDVTSASLSLSINMPPQIDDADCLIIPPHSLNRSRTNSHLSNNDDDERNVIV